MPTLKTLQFSIMYQKVASDLSKVTMIGYLKKQNKIHICFAFSLKKFYFVVWEKCPIATSYVSGSFLSNFFPYFGEKYNGKKDKEGKGFLKKNNSH